MGEIRAASRGYYSLDASLSRQKKREVIVEVL